MRSVLAQKSWGNHFDWSPQTIICLTSEPFAISLFCSATIQIKALYKRDQTNANLDGQTGPPYQKPIIIYASFTWYSDWNASPPPRLLNQAVHSPDVAHGVTLAGLHLQHNCSAHGQRESPVCHLLVVPNTNCPHLNVVQGPLYSRTYALPHKGVQPLWFGHPLELCQSLSIPAAFRFQIFPGWGFWDLLQAIIKELSGILTKFGVFPVQEQT